MGMNYLDETLWATICMLCTVCYPMAVGVCFILPVWRTRTDAATREYNNETNKSDPSPFSRCDWRWNDRVHGEVRPWSTIRCRGLGNRRDSRAVSTRVAHHRTYSLHSVSDECCPAKARSPANDWCYDSGAALDHRAPPARTEGSRISTVRVPLLGCSPQTHRRQHRWRWNRKNIVPERVDVMSNSV